MRYWVLSLLLIVAQSEEFTGIFDSMIKKAQQRAQILRESGSNVTGFKDALSMFVDYTSDRFKNPPDEAIEANLLLLQLEITRLRHSVHKMQTLLNSVGIESSVIPLRCAHKLVPVQPQHKSKINNISQAC